MGSKTTVTITQRIRVDPEIADHIMWLNEQGVRTEGSCSGHGTLAPTATITPGSVVRAKELGFTPLYMEDQGLFQIALKDDVVRSPISFEEMVTQPYQDVCFAAGLVHGHDIDTIYFELSREDRPDLTLLLRRDEALALIWVLSGALWAEQIQVNGNGNEQAD